MLYPLNTSSRSVISLDGIWSFSLVPYGTEYDASVPMKDGRPMPVPSSYNDIYEGREVRDHVGDVAYETVFSVCPYGKNVILRFGSVTHHAKVYLNGELIGTHKGGFLPFEFDITGRLCECCNRLTVVVNNIVDHSTLPCGTIQHRTFPGMETQHLNFPNFDYFNYAGINRPVVLCLVPATHVTDIFVSGDSKGDFCYRVTASGTGKCHIDVCKDGKTLFGSDGMDGAAHIDGALLWSPGSPELYDLNVRFTAEDGSVDTYTEQFGFRTVEVKDCALWLNGERIYLKGFGKHEDSPVLGRGQSNAYNVKDLALMKWMGANSFRTSHYPYSEDMMRLCDRMGILVIDETPAVGMHTTFTATGMKVDVVTPTWETLKTASHHRDVIRDMISRDKNHPCVIMWSIANEPASEEKGAYDYFKPLFDYARELDPIKRPLTFATHSEATVETCEVAPLCDVLCINRYYGWYQEEGNIPAAKAILREEMDRYHNTYPDKPIVISEFGADTVAGLHDSTATMFSEEFQRDLIRAYCEVFDERAYFCGEHVWNFADFATAESVKRVQGNKKGIFTRDRKPKLAAWYLKERWTEK